MVARTCIVTGATSGIGLGVCEDYVARGFRVIGIGRRASRLQALAAHLGERFRGVPFDVGRPGLLEAIDLRPLEDVELVVHAAGCTRQGTSLVDMSEDDVLTQIHCNVRGTALVMRDALTLFRRRGEGTIVAIGSIAARDAAPNMAVYSATKAFVNQLVKSVRADAHGEKIRVACLEPGSTRTPFLDGQPPAGRFDGYTPLEIRDVADAVAWIHGLPKHVNVQQLVLCPVDQAMYVRGVHRVARHPTSDPQPQNAMVL